MLIIEIILTIFAWRKGWKWLSLIPIVVAFCIGIIIGLSGGTTDLTSYIIWDFLAIVILILMNITTPNKSVEPPKTPTT